MPRWPLLLIPLLAVCTATTPARAQPAAGCPLQPSVSAARLEALRHLREAKRRPWLRRTSLEAAYRLYPDPTTLYNLGEYWHEQGDRIAAADLLRRALHEAGGRLGGAEGRVRSVLAGIHGARGELTLRSEPCALAYVGTRLVGRLPLSLPLMLPPGPHVLRVEWTHRSIQRTVLIKANEAQVLEVALPPAVVVLEAGGGPPSPLRLLAERIAAAEGLAVVDRHAIDVATQRPPALAGCLEEARCQAELVRRLEAQYVLQLRSRPAPAIVLADIAIGPAAEATALPDEALIRRVLREGLGRPRGELALRAEPEAELVLDGAPRGPATRTWPVFAGRHEIVLTRRPGYHEHRESVIVKPGLTTTLAVVMKAERPAPPPRWRRGPRPRWRLGLGAAALLLGAGAGTYGVGGLAIDGQCTDAVPCQQVYQTRGLGIGFTLTGGLLLLGGGLLLGWPGPLQQVKE